MLGKGAVKVCHLQFDERYLKSVRWEMAELSKEVLDMVIMSEVMVCSELMS